MLWVVFACLTAAVLFALLRPLIMAKAGAPERDLSNAQVYRDQLKEIESDRDRGLIAETEAEAARLEIERRLLASDRKAREAGADDSRKLSAWLVPVVGLGLPALVLSVYFIYGSPGLPDEPLEARLEKPVTAQDVPALIARVEQRLRQHPEDGKGWDVIAPVYMNVQRYGDAADAYQKAIALLGPSGARYAGLGEALTLNNQGIVSDEARAALEQSVKLDPTELKPRILLALADEQNGNYNAAIKAWQSLRDQMKGNDRWQKLVDKKIAEDEAKRDGKPVPGAPATAQAGSGQPGAGQPGGTQPAPRSGPSQADIAAAQNMTPEQRQAMITQMVQRLAQRLDQNGDDIEGWLKLVRAYVVLDRRQDAEQALNKAKSHFSGNASALARLNALADALGLQS